MRLATSSLSKSWFYAIGVLFVSFSSFMLTREQYWFLFVPMALWFVYFVTFSIDRSLLFITFITPLSVLVDVRQLGISFRHDGVVLPQITH